MAIESFDVTDANGKRVQGTVEVFRDPKGEYYDPASPFYRKGRFANARFEFLNTREACTIDRSVLEEAMQKALHDAVEKFGISAPDKDTVGQNVKRSIDATREQCARNPDKYVLNETVSSANWSSDKAFGDLTARAYVAVPDERDGFQSIVASENTWPDNSGLGPSHNTRVLSRRLAGQSQAPAFGTVGSAISNRQGSFYGRSESKTHEDVVLPDPNPRVVSSERGDPFGSFTGGPVPMRSVLPRAFGILDRSGAIGNGSGNWPPLPDAIPSPGNKLRASVFDVGTSAVPLGPFDGFHPFGRENSDVNQSGVPSPLGLAGRIAALASFDSTSPDGYVLRPQNRDFHTDDPPQPWWLRAPVRSDRPAVQTLVP